MQKETENLKQNQVQLRNAAVTNSFALQSVVMTFLSLFGALLSKFNSGFVGTGAVEQGYSFATLQWFLIGTAAFVGLFGLSIVIKEVGASGLLHGNVAGAARIAARTPRLRKPERNHETSGLAGTKAGPKVIV
jgi:hypothetical protein